MRPLTAHLRHVDETYLQHMRHALSFAIWLLLAALACFMHALLPFLFEKSGSDIVCRMHERMVLNRHKLTPRANDNGEQATA